MKWLDQDKPATKIKSCQDVKKRKDSLHEGFAEAYQPSLTQPWDKFVAAAMPDPNDAVRQPLQRNAFGRITFTTKHLEKSTLRCRSMPMSIPTRESTANGRHRQPHRQPHRQAETSSTIALAVQEIRTRRSSAVLSHCGAQKALAWWVYTTMFKFFKGWKKGVRLSAWSRKRPDPYASYSSMLDSGRAPRDHANEVHHANGALLDDTPDTTGPLVLPEENQHIELMPQKKMLTTRQNDPLFGKAAAFIDQWKQARRDVIKRNAHASDRRTDVLENKIASMEPQVLLPLSLRFFHKLKKQQEELLKRQQEQFMLQQQLFQLQLDLQKKEADADSTDLDAMPPAPLGTTLPPLATTPPSPKLEPCPVLVEQTFQELSTEFMDFVDTCGVFNTQNPTQKHPVLVAGKNTATQNNRTKGTPTSEHRGSVNFTTVCVGGAAPVYVVPRRPTLQNAKSMVRSLNRAAAAATSQSPKRRVSLAMHHGRSVHRPTFRVLLVDDSKPFRIKLVRLFQLLFENVVVEECATPQEGVKKVMHASNQQPIHIAIVDQIFVGTEQTGLEMCHCLGRKRSAWTNTLPCILISDYGHLHPPAAAAGNIVERCHKKNISKNVLLKWCTEYARLNSRE